MYSMHMGGGGGDSEGIADGRNKRIQYKVFGPIYSVTAAAIIFLYFVFVVSYNGIFLLLIMYLLLTVYI